MTNEKQPPRGTEDLGPGTRTEGRLGKKTPIEEDMIVGNHGPPYRATGVDALSPLLERVDFPTTTDGIKERIGIVQVPIDRNRTRRVREIMDTVGPMRFQSSQEVHRAVEDVWDRVADEPGRGSHHRQGDDASGRPPES